MQGIFGGYELVSITETSSGDTHTVTVPAPEGKKVLAGGGHTPAGVPMVASYPADDGASWVVQFKAPFSEPMSVTGYAVCADVS